ncbi:12460_t:CDS:2 [Ambispora gerdemannii]|uniref:H/ACA ribonucleoprotein complex subunit 2 n=1 Tax=Ambispora gerdemannii TaxID=144530 RepID=A0A9N8Z2A5_9GLOM|nr:12460_t:CDS:2 [Ambispora gerdemannii]
MEIDEKNHEEQKPQDEDFIMTEKESDRGIREKLSEVSIDTKEHKKDKEREVKFSYNLNALSPIARPLASEDLTKKLLRTVQQAARKKHLTRGVKEVVKGLRKGSKGLVVIAGDISPIDVITHLPVLCEENYVPYVYVPSKLDLGFNAATKRPTSVVMVIPGGPKGKLEGIEDYKKLYDSCFQEAKKMDEEMVI